MACHCGPPRVPSFNIVYNVWQGYFGLIPPGIPATFLNLPCQLCMGELVVNGGLALTTGMFLKLPARTDIHWARGGGQDVVEVPAGTGRFYKVTYADDVGRGFLNEYRVAYISMAVPPPVPLP